MDTSDLMSAPPLDVDPPIETLYELAKVLEENYGPLPTLGDVATVLARIADTQWDISAFRNRRGVKMSPNTQTADATCLRSFGASIFLVSHQAVVRIVLPIRVAELDEALTRHLKRGTAS